MIKVKYFAKENFNFDTHSFYAVPVPNGTMSFDEVCEDACRNTTIEESIMKAAVTEYMKSVQANLKRGFRVQVGESFITVYPMLDVSVKDTTDKDGKPVAATSKMVSANKGKSRLGATVAVKFSKEFAQSVSWQKVDEKTGAEVADDEDIVDGDGEGPSVKPMG